MMHALWGFNQVQYTGIHSTCFNAKTNNSIPKFRPRFPECGFQNGNGWQFSIFFCQTHTGSSRILVYCSCVSFFHMAAKRRKKQKSLEQCFCFPLTPLEWSFLPPFLWKKGHDQNIFPPSNILLPLLFSLKKSLKTFHSLLLQLLIYYEYFINTVYYSWCSVLSAVAKIW